MDDELDPPGLTGLGGYALGRMAAQNERALDDFGRSLQRRLRPATPTVDVGALLAENESLRRQLEATQTQLATLVNDYNELDAWATGAAALMSKKGLIKD